MNTQHLISSDIIAYSHLALQAKSGPCQVGLDNFLTIFWKFFEHFPAQDIISVIGWMEWLQVSKEVYFIHHTISGDHLQIVNLSFYSNLLLICNPFTCYRPIIYYHHLLLSVQNSPEQNLIFKNYECLSSDHASWEGIHRRHSCIHVLCIIPPRTSVAAFAFVIRIAKMMKMCIQHILSNGNAEAWHDKDTHRLVTVPVGTSLQINIFPILAILDRQGFW